MSYWTKWAGFKGTKAILSEIIEDEERKIYNYILSGLRPYEKYFPMIWEHWKRESPAPYELISDAKHIFKEFEGIRNNLERKDFNDYESFTELSSVVNQYNLDRLEKQRGLRSDKNLNRASGEAELEAGDSTLIYEDNGIILYRINSKSGANSLAGKDTSWCITKMDQNLYEQYTSTNLIFYFCINKNIELNERLQKVAIRVMRGSEGEIRDIKYTSKLNDGDNRDPREIPWYNKIYGAMISDAKVQPESLFSKLQNNRATEEEEEELWENYRSSSISEKRDISKYSEKFKERLNKILMHEFTLEEVVGLDLKLLDAATLEKIAEDIYDEELYIKLSKLRYNGVDLVLGKRTINPKLLIELYSRGFDNVRLKILKNKKCPKILVYKFVQEGGDIIQLNEKLRTIDICKIYIDNGGKLFNIPKELKLEHQEEYNKLCEVYFDKTGDLPSIPKELRTFERCKRYIYDYGGLLQDVPEDLRTRELCLEYVKNNRDIRYIPKEFMTKEYLLEYLKNGALIEDVPEKLITYDLLKSYVKLCDIRLINLFNIPEVFWKDERFKEICRIYISRGGDLYKVPNIFESNELDEIYKERRDKFSKTYSNVQKLSKLYIRLLK